MAEFHQYNFDLSWNSKLDISELASWRYESKYWHFFQFDKIWIQMCGNLNFKDKNKSTVFPQLLRFWMLQSKTPDNWQFNKIPDSTLEPLIGWKWFVQIYPISEILITFSVPNLDELVCRLLSVITCTLWSFGKEKNKSQKHIFEGVVHVEYVSVKFTDMWGWLRLLH